MPPAKCSGYVQNGVTQECIFNPQKQRVKALTAADGAVCGVQRGPHGTHMCDGAAPRVPDASSPLDARAGRQRL